MLDGRTWLGLSPQSAVTAFVMVAWHLLAFANVHSRCLRLAVLVDAETCSGGLSVIYSGGMLFCRRAQICNVVGSSCVTRISVQLTAKEDWPVKGSKHSCTLHFIFFSRMYLAQTPFNKCAIIFINSKHRVRIFRLITLRYRNWLIHIITTL